MTVDLDPGVIRRLADMHAVYRMFDHAGRLLYIGKSGRAGRFDEHAVKRWFPLVSAITLEWHATHAEAMLAEKRAIAAERPRYNIAGSPVAPKRAVRGKVAAVLPMAPPKPPNVLSDVLKVFGDAKGLHWQTIAERLAKQFPGRWADVTRDAISVQCRDLGVPSVQVHALGVNRQGCRRTSVEDAVTRRLQGL